MVGRNFKSRAGLMVLVFALALLVFLHRVHASEPATLKASVNKSVALTTDTVRFLLELESEAGVAGSIPQIGDRIQGFRIVDAGENPVVKREGRTLQSRWYDLRADVSGSYILPDVHLTAQTSQGPLELKTPKIFVEVKSRLEADGQGKGLRDIKPLIEPKIPLWKILLGIALALTLLAAAWGLKVHLKKRAKTALIQKLPLPDQWALQDLDLLRKKFPFPWKDEDIRQENRRKEFYFRLSEIFRAYLEKRFGFLATDQTTEEILPRLNEVFNKEGLVVEVLNWAKAFLQDTDLVKFTDQIPQVEEPERYWQLAKTFVMRTRIIPSVTEVNEFKKRNIFKMDRRSMKSVAERVGSH